MLLGRDEAGGEERRQEMTGEEALDSARRSQLQLLATARGRQEARYRSCGRPEVKLRGGRCRGRCCVRVSVGVEAEE